MVSVVLAEEVADDFGRIIEHLRRYEVAQPDDRIREILAAFDVLERNPEIGRPSGNGMRELVIGKRSHGYLALYRYAPEVDTVFVLAVRSQREAGYH